MFLPKINEAGEAVITLTVRNPATGEAYSKDYAIRHRDQMGDLNWRIRYLIEEDKKYEIETIAAIERAKRGAKL